MVPVSATVLSHPLPLSALHCVMRPWTWSRERGVTLFAPCVVQRSVLPPVKHRSQFCPEGCSVSFQRGGVFLTCTSTQGLCRSQARCLRRVNKLWLC